MRVEEAEEGCAAVGLARVQRQQVVVNRRQRPVAWAADAAAADAASAVLPQAVLQEFNGVVAWQHFGCATGAWPGA